MNTFTTQKFKTTYTKIVGVLILFLLMASSINSYSQCGGGSASWCTPTATSGPASYNMGISNVTYGSINNSTASSATIYTDFTNLSTAVAAGTSQTMSIGLYVSPYAQHCGVWIDWDNNGTFATGGAEQVMTVNNTSSTPVTTTVTCPSGTSPGAKRMRVVSEYYGQGFPTPCNGYYSEFEDYTVVVATSGVNIAAVALTSPSTWAVGNNTISLRYQNVGIPTITTASFGYSCTNGSSSIISSVTLPSSITTGQTGVYTFGTPLSITAGTYTLKVWVNNPNGTQPDAFDCNDTLKFTVCTGMSGAFTINPSGSGSSNYTTFGAAVSALNNCGVSGAVSFTVSAGTYNEQISLGNIAGASATNTITFDGVDSATRILSYNTSGAGAVVDLNGAKYVTLKNLTVSNSYTSTAGVSYFAVRLRNAANFNKILSCKLVVPKGTNYYAIPFAICGTNYYDAGDHGNNNLIDGNRLIGGYMGMAIEGNSAYPCCVGNIISNNRIEDAYQYGVYLLYQTNFKFDHNTINMDGNMASSYGLYVNYVGTADFTRNTINASYYGFYFYSYTTYGPTGFCNITNNILNSIAGGTSYTGLYMSSANNTNICHNTVIDTKDNGYAFLSYISYSGNRVNNNIFIVTKAIALGMYVAYNSTSYYTSFDYNTLIVPSGSVNLANFGGTVYANLTTLKTANASFNQNNNNVQPVFVSTTDFHLSSAIEQARGLAGTGVTIDIDGDARCVFAPSIGADESGYVTAPPTAGFTVGTIYINSPITFLNNYSATLPMSHKWYLNGVLVSSNPNWTTTFTTLGANTICLKSTNCSGSDSTCVTISVVTPGTPPLSDFIANISVVNTYQNIQFTDLSSNGPTSWLWTVSPGTIGVDYFFGTGTSATSQNPIMYFASSGSYSICMKASNGVGAGSNRCKTNYIVVLAAQSMCIFPFSTKVPIGNLYSSGGPLGGYSQNENCTFTIDACADSTYLNVTAAAFGSGTVDRFEVYQGDYVPGQTPVAAFMAPNVYSNLPQIIRVKGKMTVREVTDATANNGAGIKANWYTTAGTFVPPSGSITGSNNAYYCGSGIYNYYSSTFRDPTYSYDWDFDNDGLVDFNGMDGYFSFVSTGPDTIKLKITGCGGTITLSKFVTIISPPAPTANFNTTLFTATNVDTIQLNDLSTGGVLTWKWTITGPGTINYVGGTSSTSRNPKVMGIIAGNYSVKLVVTNCTGSDSISFTNYFKILGYCIPTAGNLLSDLTVSKFQMGSINNTITVPLPGTIPYRDFSQTVYTNVDRGATYPFTVTRTSNYNNAGIKIWVDWNQDGTFDPITELAASVVTGNMTWSSNLFTPKTATLGATRLRIGVNYNTLLNTPCGANIYGEYQDYRVIVRPDVSAPVLTLGGSNPTSIEIGRTFVENGDVAIDAVDGIVTDSIVYSGYITGRGYQQPISKQTTALGTFTVTVMASDLTGNVATATRTVIVTPDITKPVITLNGTNPMFVEVYSSFVDPGATATDFFFTSAITVNATNNVDTAHLGSYTVTYTATDVNGNAAVSISRTVIVRDTQKPVIVFPANTDTVYVEVRSNYSDAGATVTDNYYTGLTATWTGSVNTYVPGTYYYTFSATDGSGNISLPRIRVIIVRDGTAPELILASPSDPDTLVLEAKAYTIVPEPGYVATDNFYPASQITVSKSGSVDLNKIGIYVVTYTATDPAGNSSAPKRRIYKLVDTTKPVITINGSNSINICRWKPYTDLGATVTDNYWSGLQVVTSSNIDMNLPGIYIITYSAVDSSGNVATQVLRYVNVLDEKSSSCQAFTGINNNASNNTIQVVPNPSNGLITIDIAFATETQREIVIYNSLGQIVKVVDNALIANAKYTVDLQNEASGIYFVTVKSENNTYTKKFVLNK